VRSLVVVLPLSPLQVGDEFRRADWPPHVTLIPPFSADAPAAAILVAIGTAAEGHAALSATGEARAGFGRRGAVPVTTVTPVEPFRALHLSVLAAIDRFLPHGTRLSHVGPDYRPHVTDQATGRLEPGTSVILRQLAVIDMRPDEDAGRRRVVGTFPLR
jgi:hypothetical protein